MMYLEEEKDYSLEDLQEYGQNPESFEPYQEFDEPEKSQDPIEPFIIHTNPGKESLYYYHLDHLGTPVKMTDENGKVVWSMECSPFMEICSFTGEIIQPLRFPGQYYDEETGLHYNWHRYYKPDWGRYVEPDKIENIALAIGYRTQFILDTDRPNFNKYLYSSNSPCIWIDPTGLIHCTPQQILEEISKFDEMYKRWQKETKLSWGPIEGAKYLASSGKRGANCVDFATELLNYFRRISTRCCYPYLATEFRKFHIPFIPHAYVELRCAECDIYKDKKEYDPYWNISRFF